MQAGEKQHNYQRVRPNWVETNLKNTSLLKTKCHETNCVGVAKSTAAISIGKLGHK